MMGLILSLFIPKSFPLIIRMEEAYWLIENELEPIKVNLEFKELSIMETEASIPTNAIIPKEIIMTVNMVRNNCVFIEPNAILIFSLKTPFIFRVCH